LKGRGSGKESMVELILSIFFPRRCPICDRTIAYGQKICEDCVEKLVCIAEPVCKKCGKQLENERQEYCGDCMKKEHYFTQGKAVFSYQKEMKLSMYRFKYANRREYATFYAEWAMERYGEWIRKRGIEVIIPVPMFAGKRRNRGYNQAEVFAKELSDVVRIPVDKNLVKRVKNTKPLKTLTERQRKDNLKGAFQVGANIVKYSKILLVDDIYTTGATIDAVAEVLREAGIKEVYFLSVCIGEGY